MNKVATLKEFSKAVKAALTEHELTIGSSKDTLVEMTLTKALKDKIDVDDVVTNPNDARYGSLSLMLDDLGIQMIGVYIPNIEKATVLRLNKAKKKDGTYFATLDLA